MAKTRRRVLSILMALVLTLGLLPTAALAGYGGGNQNCGFIEVDVENYRDEDIEGATVTLYKWEYGPFGIFEYQAEAKTDSDGEHTFRNLGAGYYKVVATKDGKSDYKKIYLRAGQKKEVGLKLNVSGGSSGQGQAAWFFIRNDGTIPYENGTTGYLAAQYSPEHPSSGTSGAGMLTGTIASASEVHVNFTSDDLGAITAEELEAKFQTVDNHIVTAPTNDAIKTAVPSFDPETQEVLWYVVKNHDGGHQGGCPNWHVDGVIIDKAAKYVYLNYDKNTDAMTVTGMPASASVKVGNSLTVGGAPTWEGHDFLGWNTRADGKGTVYQPSQSITMNENVTLYAIWKDALPSLTITKVVANSAENASRTFTFAIKDSDGEVVKTASVAMRGNGSKSVNVYGLATGTYTVTETDSQGAQTVSYNPADKTVSVVADATATMTVTNDYTVPQANLLITKTGTDSVLAGGRITYQITVANNGTADATDKATVTDNLTAAGLTYVSAVASNNVGTVSEANGVITWEIPADALEMNESVLLTVTADVPAGYKGTSVTNTATITSADLNTEKAEKTTAVTPLGDLVIEKTFTGLTEAPEGFNAWFTVGNGNSSKTVYWNSFTKDTSGNSVVYRATVEDLPQGSGYTVTETVSAGSSVAGEVEGTKGNYVLGTVNVTYPDGGTSAAVGAQPVTVQVENPYTWTPNTQITVNYAWASGSVAWPDATDPMTAISGKTYNVAGFTAADLADVPTITVPGYTITGWSTAEDGAAMADADLVEAVNDVKGGNAITLYAKLTYDKPAYQVRYAYYAYVDGASEATLMGTGAYGAGAVTETAPTKEFVFTNAAASVAYNGTSYDKASTKDLTNDQLQALYESDVTADGGTWGDKNNPPKFTVKMYATTYTVGSLTIEKTINLPLSETAAFNELMNTVTFTVDAVLDSGEDFEPVVINLKDFKDDVHSYFTFSYTLENLEPGTYTVTESDADILSTYGYTWNAENSITSAVVEVKASGMAAAAKLVNDYDSREFTVIFDATLYGNVYSSGSTLVNDGDSFRYIWYAPLTPVALDTNTTSAEPSWQGRLFEKETHNNSEASQVSYTFTLDEYQDFDLTITQPRVSPDSGYVFTGRFIAAGGASFESLEETVKALLASGEDEITYFANYTINGDTTPPDPGPSDPGTTVPDEGTPTTELPDEETPMAEDPGEETVEEIPDEETPLAEVPATGDTAVLWALAAGVSGLALVWLALSGKKRREENA